MFSTQMIRLVEWCAQVDWSQDRYDDIRSQLKAFLVQSGFHPSKTYYVPVGAMDGVNLINRKGAESAILTQWYSGPTLVDLLGKFFDLLAGMFLNEHSSRYSSTSHAGYLKPPALPYFQCIQGTRLWYRSFW